MCTGIRWHIAPLSYFLRGGNIVKTKEAVKGENTMELHTVTKKIGAVETVFDDFDERPIDCDFVLPDYLPDIAAVLKCILRPTVQSHQISGDRVIADGIVTLQVLYLDEERKCMRSFEMTQPFSSTFIVKTMDSGYDTVLSAKVNYVNCRATGPRHVDIHGAFSVKLTVQKKGETGVVCAADTADLYVKDTEITYSVPAAAAQKSFTVNEVLELENGVAEMILRTDTAVKVEECRQMMGKAIVKGELLLKTIFAQDTVQGTMGTSHHTIPFSQIVDADGLDDEDLCRCTAVLLSCEVHPAQNPGGENKLLSVSAKICLSLHSYHAECDRVIADAYHTRFPLKASGKRLALTRITHCVNDTHSVREHLDLPDGDVQEIVDLWCDTPTVTCECAQDAVNAQGYLLVCMVARDSKGVLSYYERPLNFTLPLDVVCDRMIAELSVLRHEWSCAGGTLDLRLTVQLCGVCMTCAEPFAITDLVAEESAPYTCPESMRRCSLKAYFASAGESVWEIAKQQHTSVHALRAENQLETDTLAEDTMLLIPLC